MIHVLLSILFLSMSNLANATTVESLANFSNTWEGKALHYPKGDLEISTVKITIDGYEVIDWHCHPVPILGYVLSGNKLRVETKEGREKIFNAGDIINEVVDTYHKGTNLSDTPIELIVFYLGIKNMPTTIHYREGKVKCTQ